MKNLCLLKGIFSIVSSLEFQTCLREVKYIYDPYFNETLQYSLDYFRKCISIIDSIVENIIDTLESIHSCAQTGLTKAG